MTMHGKHCIEYITEKHKIYIYDLYSRQMHGKHCIEYITEKHKIYIYDLYSRQKTKILKFTLT